MQRSFRFTQLRLSKLDRFHLRNVESRISGRVLFARFYSRPDLRPAAPPQSPQLAAAKLAEVLLQLVPSAVAVAVNQKGVA